MYYRSLYAFSSPHIAISCIAMHRALVTLASCIASHYFRRDLRVPGRAQIRIKTGKGPGWLRGWYLPQTFIYIKSGCVCFKPLCHIFEQVVGYIGKIVWLLYLLLCYVIIFAGTDTQCSGLIKINYYAE